MANFIISRSSLLIPFKGNGNFRLSLQILTAVAIVLSSIVQCTLGIEGNSNSEPVFLNVCNQSEYPEKWENIMDRMDLKYLDRSRNNAYLNVLEEIKKFRGLLATTKSFDEYEDEEQDHIVPEGTLKEWTPPSELFEHQSSVTFRMLDKEIDCETSSKILHWHSARDQIRMERNETMVTIDGTTIDLSEVLIAKDGRLVWKKEDGESEIFEKNDYCAWKRGDNWVTFKACRASCFERDICVRKCCLPWEILDENTKSCQPSNSGAEWRPKFHGNFDGTNLDTRRVRTVSGYPNCLSKYLIQENSIERFELLLNGSFKLVEENGIIIPPGEFCIDAFQYQPFENPKFARSEQRQVVIACTPTSHEQQFEKLRITIYMILNLISAAFLLVVAVIFVAIWRRQSGVQSWIQFSYVTLLLMAFTAFAVIQWWSNDLFQVSVSLCIAAGWVTHFFNLSTFFWLTSMTTEIYWRLSQEPTQAENKSCQKFLHFAKFSTAVPLVISCIGASIDNYYRDTYSDPPFPVPGMGKEKCYFSSTTAQIPYLQFPAGVLLVVNVIFFAKTVRILRKQKTNVRTEVRILAKLLLMTGFAYIFELIMRICSIYEYEHRLIVVYTYLTIDCLIALQGVLVFLILVVCNPPVRSHLLALFRRSNPPKPDNNPENLSCTSSAL